MAGRYAAALFDLAKEQKQLDAVASDFKQLTSLLDESSDLRRLVLSPVISSDDQLKALKVLLAKAGSNPLTANFLLLITRNRRLARHDALVCGAARA